MAERILDIVAEHPQKQHVAAEMEDVGVQEGIGEIGQALRHQHQLGRQLGMIEGDDGDVAERYRRRFGKALPCSTVNR